MVDLEYIEETRTFNYLIIHAHAWTHAHIYPCVYGCEFSSTSYTVLTIYMYITLQILAFVILCL